jgi:dihydropteroate synthase
VIRGDGPRHRAAPPDDLTIEARTSLSRLHDRFALIVENADDDLREADRALESVGAAVLALPALEKDVTRHLLMNVPPDLEPGLSPLTDLLKVVIEGYRGETMEGFLDDLVPAPRRTLLMGILNTTPDSFSDDGLYHDEDAAVRRAMTMIDEGADLIDVGGCSTRPGAEEPTPEEELRRTVPVIERIRSTGDAIISIDTYRPEVARRALDAGARLINDVTALNDTAMAELAAERRVPVLLMHMQGTPRTMQKDPHYDDLLAETTRFLRRAVDRAVKAGIREERIAVDPGFGFGKTVEHNLRILRGLHEYRSLGRPVAIGASRKSTIGRVLDRPVDRRQMGTAATVALAVISGASIIRVHDVAAMRDVVRMTEAVHGRTDK